MATPYTNINMVAYTYDQLCQAADGLGIYIDLSMSRAALIAAILAK